MPINKIKCLMIDWLQTTYLDAQTIEEDAQASNMLVF